VLYAEIARAYIPAAKVLNETRADELEAAPACAAQNVTRMYKV